MFQRPPPPHSNLISNYSLPLELQPLCLCVGPQTSQTYLCLWAFALAVLTNRTHFLEIIPSPPWVRSSLATLYLYDLVLPAVLCTLTLCCHPPPRARAGHQTCAQTLSAAVSISLKQGRGLGSEILFTAVTLGLQ